MDLTLATHSLPYLLHVDDTFGCSWVKEPPGPYQLHTWLFLVNRDTDWLPLFSNVLDGDGNPANAPYVQMAKAKFGEQVRLAGNTGLYFDFTDGAFVKFRDAWAAVLDAHPMGYLKMEFGEANTVWATVKRKTDGVGLLAGINHIIDQNGLDQEGGPTVDPVVPLDVDRTSAPQDLWSYGTVDANGVLQT